MDNEILNKILNKLESMDNKINSMDNKISSMDDKINSMDEGQQRIEIEIAGIKKDISKVDDKLIDLEAKNATSHSEMRLANDKVLTEVKFIRHRLNETEKDIFTLCDHLKIVK
ncbi:MAG: hypothetical protein ACRC68_13525 [Clostridium sp.]